jgi:SAM-dependent methyltransferase
MVEGSLQRILDDPEQFVFAVFSGGGPFEKVRIRPILLKGRLFFQVASFTERQCFTKNIDQDAFVSLFRECSKGYRQLVIRFLASELYLHFDGEKIKKREKALKTKASPSLSHNREKQYLVKESGVMQELGIMNREGKVLREKYDKYKQINRFLEIALEAVADKKNELTIVDCGCGKAYLTFALYERLENARLIGIDLRDDVIEKCQNLAQKLEFSRMQFVKSTIEQFETQDVDMVVALHACDTATDDALLYGLRTKAKVMLIAPCCQHEVARQLNRESLPLISKHNLLHERFSALLTDAIRAEVLQLAGYEVDLIEFVDPEHTPKNLLIRAVKRREVDSIDLQALQSKLSFFGVLPKIVREQRRDSR